MERVLTFLKSGGAFLFFLAKTIAKKTIQMDFFKNIFAKKWAFFRFLAEKFFLWRRARSRGVGVRGVLARRSGRVWMDVPGRAWMEAMEVVHV